MKDMIDKMSMIERIAATQVNTYDDLSPNDPWGFKLIADSRDAVHDGDCTKRPYSCCKCLYERATKNAALTLRAVGYTELVDALKETLEVAQRNEAGPFSGRAAAALHKAGAL